MSDRHRPMAGFESLVTCVGQRRQGPDVEQPLARILERPREPHVRGRSAAGLAKSKASPKPMRRATSQMMRQSGRASPGNRHERSLPRQPSLRIGHHAVLLAPAGGGQQNVGVAGRVGARNVGDDDEIAGLERGANAACIRHRDGRIGAHDPQRLDAAVAGRLEQVDRLQATACARCSARSRSAPRARHRPGSRSSYARRAGWRARRPRGRPSRWAGR